MHDNREVASSMPTLGIFLCCVLAKDNSLIPTSGDADQWVRAQVGNRKIWRLLVRFLNWAMRRCVLERPLTPILP